jgi:hypothetical protein
MTTKQKKEDPVKEPFIELPEQTQKIRRNLLAVSIISITIVLFGGVTGDPEIAGLKIEGLDSKVLHVCILCIITYEFCYFCFLSRRIIHQWWLRSTGFSELEVMGGYGGAITLPEQNTILAYIEIKTKTAIEQLERLRIKSSTNVSESTYASLKGDIVSLNNNLKSFNEDAKAITPFIEHFKKYQREYIGNFIFEFIIPAILGFMAMCFMMYQVAIDYNIALWVAEQHPEIYRHIKLTFKMITTKATIPYAYYPYMKNIHL